MIAPVRTDLDAYRIAVAELPASAVRSSAADGAVVVVSGEGAWWTAVSAAAAAGAQAVVVARPVVAGPVDQEALDGIAGGIPVILERALLRADVADALRAATHGAGRPAAVVVECHAPARALPMALGDAIGWARLVGGSPLTRRAGEPTGDGLLALLETADGAAVSVVAAAQPGAPSLGRVRLTTIAETRVEIDLDLGTVVAVTDAAGRRLLPARLESPERVALRRAVAAASTGERPSDLADLRHDAVLAAALLRPPIT